MRSILGIMVLLTLNIGTIYAQEGPKQGRPTGGDDKAPNQAYPDHTLHQGAGDADSSVRVAPAGADDKFCAYYISGKMVVMNAGKAITETKIFASGASVTKDGTLTNKEGKKRALKNGECVDKDNSAKR